MTTHLTPAGPRLSRLCITWPIDAAAQAGRDDTLESLLPFWQLASEQDGEICERIQPGPFFPGKEYNLSEFLR